MSSLFQGQVPPSGIKRKMAQTPQKTAKRNRTAGHVNPKQYSEFTSVVSSAVGSAVGTHSDQSTQDLKHKTDSQVQPVGTQNIQTLHTSSVKDDKIDPVEKLLSMTCSSSDILHMDDESATISASDSAYPSLTLNFTKAINDNLKSYYLRLCRSPMEVHHDHSSFSVLNAKPTVEAPPPARPAAPVPFFRNVNFSASPMGIDDYIYYDDDDEPSSTDSEHEELPASTPQVQLVVPCGKMSFQYRHNDNVNLSLSDVPVELEPQDIYKVLNRQAVVSGRASEMIGMSSFMLRDFFV